MAASTSNGSYVESNPLSLAASLDSSFDDSHDNALNLSANARSFMPSSSLTGAIQNTRSDSPRNDGNDGLNQSSSYTRPSHFGGSSDDDNAADNSRSLGGEDDDLGGSLAVNFSSLLFDDI